MIHRCQFEGLRRAIGVFSLAMTLGACATVTPSSGTTTQTAATATPATQTPASGLPSQSLAAGECGLFGWDTSNSPQFVFFATADRALYLSGEGAPQKLTPEGAFPSTRYGTLRLSLGAAEPLIAGTRYAQARVSELVEDGFTRVRPLVILRSCQTSPSNPSEQAEPPLF